VQLPLLESGRQPSADRRTEGLDRGSGRGEVPFPRQRATDLAPLDLSPLALQLWQVA